MQLTNRLRANMLVLILFAAAIISMALVTYAAGLFGGDFYQLRVPLNEAGGALPNQEVTVLGVPVGLIEDYEFSDDGIVATLKIRGDAKVPANANLQVLRRSPIGEQSIEFQPVAAPDGTWEVAEPGTTIIPITIFNQPRIPFLLETAEGLFDAVDPQDVGTIVEELAITLDGRADRLRQFNRDALDLGETLVSGIPDFERLLDTSEPVLRLLDQQGEQIRQFFGNSADLMEVLAEDRDQMEQLLETTSPALIQTAGLIENQRANIQCIAEDLIDLNEMLTGPSTGEGAVAARYDSKLDELEMLLEKSPFFFTAFDVGIQYDEVGNGWARVLLRAGEESGSRYFPERPTPPTRPGAACVTDQWGTGVNAVRQADAQPVIRGGSLELAPLVANAGPKPVPAPPSAPNNPNPLPATGGGAAFGGLALALLGALTMRRRR